ncbi:MAG: isocitrate lyase/PEP mutase family protein [Chloroflexi bacterium]|nr:isocitrate lyase/PEP mutase family protein [Chloroflexota bacterium]
MRPTTRLQELIHRTDRVLTVMNTPSARLARVMEAAGAEMGFIGTNGEVGAHTGLSGEGVNTLTEAVTVAGWVARAVKMPIVVDADGGHGGPGPIRRMIEDCIRAGIAGIRMEDLPATAEDDIPGHRVVPLDVALARFRTAVERKNELDPDFVIEAHTYARNATNGGLEDAIRRLQAYEQEAHVDWVQLGSPRSIDEIRQARAAVEGPMSFISLLEGGRVRYLSLEEHLELGVTIAVFPNWPHALIEACLSEFMHDYQDRGLAAWEAFVAAHAENPYLRNLGPTRKEI